MKNKRNFFTAAALLLFLFPLRGLGSFLYAQDTIRFTWEREDGYYYYTRSFYITATENKKFTIDWGDGDIDTITGVGTAKQKISHRCGSFLQYYDVTIAAMTPDCHFTVFRCTENRLAFLDLSKCVELDTLICLKNQLATLDLSNNTELSYLDCPNNQLTALDLSNNTKLLRLNCSNNQLAALNPSNNTELVYLNCSNNLLTALNPSNNTKLE